MWVIRQVSERDSIKQDGLPPGAFLTRQHKEPISSATESWRVNVQGLELLQKVLNIGELENAEVISPDRLHLETKPSKTASGTTYGPVYHGTTKRFAPNQIKPGPDGLIWFSDNREFAEGWGSNIIEAYITISKPEVYKDSGLHMAELDNRNFVKRLGKTFDGIIISNPSYPKLPTNYAVFSRSQVKVVTPDVKTASLNYEGIDLLQPRTAGHAPRTVADN
jgi:hypothetical protein